MSSTFRERMREGIPHERAVGHAIARQGWRVSDCGQGVWHPDIRRALARLGAPGGYPCMLRWFPDLVATDGRRVAFVDAKHGRCDTPNYVFECNALDAYEQWESLRGYHEVWLVMHDMSCVRVDDAFARVVHSVQMHDGVAAHRTPFKLVPKDALLRFSIEQAFPRPQGVPV